MPGVTHPYLDWDGPIPFAHRGGASDAPENTMPAFEYAVNLGYRYVETDVHVTADGVLVAFHDDDLGRVTDRTGSIASLPWSEVRRALVDGVAPIPMLEELLGAWPDLRVNIDCKTDRAVEALVSTIQRTNALHRVCLGAFSDRRIRSLRSRLGPSVCTALGPLGVAALRYVGVRRVGAQTAQVPVRHGRLTVVDRRFVANAHRAGVQVHVWTIDDDAEIDQLLDLGVDGIMTDRPPVLKAVLQRRGVWIDA
jgi:glycerophosphoryl diester phosphodiesterase